MKSFLLAATLLSALLASTTAMAAASARIYVSKGELNGTLLNNSQFTTISSSELNITDLAVKALAPYHLKVNEDAATLVTVKDTQGNGCLFVFSSHYIEDSGLTTVTATPIGQNTTCNVNENAVLSVEPHYVYAPATSKNTSR